MKMYIKSDNVAGKSVLYDGGPRDMWSHRANVSCSLMLAAITMQATCEAAKHLGESGRCPIQHLARPLRRASSHSRASLMRPSWSVYKRQTGISRHISRMTFTSECTVKMKTVQQCDSMQDNVGVMSSAQLRKINKPIVEKKRRERINVCLEELKDLLLQSASKQESSQSKLEKADILEMTVKHLRNTQRLQRQMSHCNSNDGDVSSYRDGYSDCAREVATYLGRLDSPGGVLVRTRVLAHLSARLRAVNSAHRRQPVPPTFQRLPVPASTAGDERCRVTTSFQPAASSTSDIRTAAPPATGTCLSDFKHHSLDGASWLDAVQRSTTPPDDKHHVTTTVTSPMYDVNGNDVRQSTPSVAAADDVQDTSLVWRPW